MPNRYAKGRRAEWRARDELEVLGFTVIRSSGSRGPFDLVAFDALGFKLIQVKTSYRTSARRQYWPQEFKTLRAIPAPSNAVKMLWIWTDRFGWEKHVVE